MSKLDLLLEAERRGILPDDKRELLSEARRRGLVPGGEQAQTEPMGTGERYLRLANSYVPGAERLTAGVGAVAEHLTAPDEDRASLGERYDRRLTRERSRNDAAQADADLVGGTAARTAGLAATAVGTGGYSLLRSGLQQGASLWQMIKEGARIGGGVGAPTALANTRETDPIAQAGDVVEGTIGGAAVGGAIPAALAGARAATLPNWRARRAQERSAHAQQVNAEFDNADVPRLPVAASDNPSVEETALRLAGRPAGAPIRAQAERSIAGLENRVRDTITEGQPMRTSAQYGEEMQEGLRTNLTGRSRSSAELDRMNRAQLEDVRGPGGFNPDESYPTQFGARYRLAEQEPVPAYQGTAADIRGNFLDRMPERGNGPTNTWRLLNEIGQEARASGQLKGWRDGDLDNPQFWDLVRGRFGQSVGDLLQSEHARSTGRQASLTIPGLRQQRTLVRRTFEDLRQGNTGQTGIGSIADLQRLHGAMTDDLQRFMNESGGSNAALRYMQTDRAYAQFTGELRAPLRRLYGDQVSPDEAFRRLHAATQRDTSDIRQLAAFYRVASEKGDPHEATRALLAPSMEGGMLGFLRGYGNLSPDARQLMGRFSPELMRTLDELAAVGERLAPYRNAIDRAKQGVDASRSQNLMLAARLFYDIPGAILQHGGPHAMARFLTSQRFADWLTRLPRAAMQGVRSPAFQAHMSRVGSLGSDDPAIGEAVLQAVGDVLRPASAEAMPRPAMPKGPGMVGIGEPGWGPSDLPQSYEEDVMNVARGDDKGIVREPPQADYPNFRSYEPEHRQEQEPLMGYQRAAFLGEKSKTADKKALVRAKEMKKAGASREDILKETGWFEDRGRWNYETDDREFKMAKDSNEFEPGKFFDHFPHPEVQGAYPDMARRLSFQENPDVQTERGFFGSFDPKDKSIDLSTKLWRYERFPKDGKMTSIPSDIRGVPRTGYYKAKPEFRDRTALHEMQHAVDDTEALDPKLSRFTMPYFERGMERRAYNTAFRKDMSPEERRQTPPWSTEDEAVRQAQTPEYRDNRNIYDPQFYPVDSEELQKYRRAMEAGDGYDDDAPYQRLIPKDWAVGPHDRSEAEPTPDFAPEKDFEALAKDAGFDIQAEVDKGTDPKEALQKAMDAVWAKNPTDANAELLDALAKRYGVKAPWEREPGGGDDGGGGGAPQQPDPPMTDMGPQPGERWPEQRIHESGPGVFASPAGVAAIAGSVAKGLLVDTPEAMQRLVQRGYEPGTRDTQAVDDAFVASGVAAGGSFAGARPKGSLSTFIGRPQAETLAQNGRPTAVKALDLAETLEARGVSSERIRLATNKLIAENDQALGGVSKTPEGVWVVELDDSAARVRNVGPGKSTLGKEMQHPELYQADPSMADVGFRRVSGTGAVHRPNEISVGQSAPSRRTATLHETQHELDRRSGLSRGTSPEYERTRLAMGATDPELSGIVDGLALDTYHRNVGEVRARNVEKRADMTPAQRRAIHPDKTQGVPTEHQLQRWDEGGVSEASNRVWTPERLADLREHLASGKTQAQAAEAMGVTDNSVENALKRHRSKADIPYHEPAPREPTEPRIVISPEQRAAIVARLKQGDHGRRVALDYQVDPATIRRIAREARGRGETIPRSPANWAPAQRDLPADTRPSLSRVGGGRKAETILDREAMGAEKQARQIEEKLVKAGRSPADVAAAINNRFGGKVTAEQVASGEVWWKVGEKADIDHRTVSYDNWNEKHGIGDRGIAGRNEFGVRGLPIPPSRAEDKNLHRVIYGDESAATADTDGLGRAKALEAGGADRQKIWDETGWWKAGDGRWLFEIDDSKAQMAAGIETVFQRARKDGAVEVPLSEILTHPHLAKAYPDVMDIPVIITKPGTNGMSLDADGVYTPDHDVIYMNSGLPAKWRKPVLIHEVMHALQLLQKRFAQNLDTPYMNRGIEAEGYNVQSRVQHSAETRRARPPWLSYPVPENEIDWAKPGAAEPEPEAKGEAHYSTRQPRSDDGRFTGPPKKARKAASKTYSGPMSSLARIGLQASP